MKLSGRIDERGLTRQLSAPATAPGDTAARAELVEGALAAVEKVCVPLALEVERGNIDRTTGMFREPPPDPPVMVFMDRDVPAHVHVGPTVAAAPAPIRGPLDWKAIGDWRRIEALATAARAGNGSDTLVLEQAPSRPVPATMRGGAPFFAGPVDADGWRMYPPMALRFDSNAGIVRLTLTAHWTPWSNMNTAERAFFDDAIAALAMARFTLEA